MENSLLEQIQASVAEGSYFYTSHAVQRTTERHISRSEIEQVIANAEVIEEYPQDKYGPSALLYGQTDEQRHIHVQISLPPAVKIITAYEPDVTKWKNYRVRKPHE